jgi:hypothetical protein
MKKKIVENNISLMAPKSSRKPSKYFQMINDQVENLEAPVSNQKKRKNNIA